MIPFSILSGRLLAEGNSIQEISILDVSRIGFPFRVPKSFHKSWDAIRRSFIAGRTVSIVRLFCAMFFVKCSRRRDFLWYIVSKPISWIIKRL